MDQALRNQLQRTTQATRRLLEQEFAAQLEGTYDILPDGTIAKKSGPHLDAGGRLVRQKLVEAVQHHIASGQNAAEAVADYSREAAFTCLNRFVALKMLEARELVQTCVSKGEQSGGFREFCGLAPGLSELPDGGYQLYLESLCDELSVEVKVLFDRRDPASLLWPRRQTLTDLLALLNDPELASVWIEDETIGWVYQYFNSPEERRQMRDESQAPRNSRELAVRNQFFTPRYVVQFLTDNTLGRIWYEMRQGQTALVKTCQYLVRRPDEVFLGNMTSPEEECPNEGCMEMVRLLQTGDESTFAAFDARDSNGVQRMIDLAHCVEGFTRRAVGDKATWKWLEHTTARVADLTVLSELSTQDILDLLYLTCRAERAGGEGGIYRERWFINAANEVRRRALRSRESDLTQEALLKQPYYVPHRPLKDPRDIKMLDPACGSMHFGLYAFDLFESVYNEAWEIEAALAESVFVRSEGLESLHKTYDNNNEAFLHDVPRLIIERNIHGIDIDPRCTQIAAFSLWMRAQRAYSELGLERSQRKPIRKTNIVVAEPMPGEEDMLEEFLRGLREDRLEALMQSALDIRADKRIRATKAMADSLCGLVRTIWDKMRLAGEAGSLLRIEEELTAAIAKGREEWEGKLPLFRMTEYDVSGQHRDQLLKFIPGEAEDFWGKAETLVLAAMRVFAAQASNGSGFRRRLFMDDAEHGFAFVNLCRYRYDSIVMNPPFGEFIADDFTFLDKNYPLSKRDLGVVFVDRAFELLERDGVVGVLFSRKPFFVDTQSEWRRQVISTHSIKPSADLGHRVLDDALVEVAASVFGPLSSDWLFIACLDAEDKKSALISAISGTAPERIYCRDSHDFQCLPSAQFSYTSPRTLLSLFSKCNPMEPDVALVRMGLSSSDNDRFLRLAWELPPRTGTVWTRIAKGGEYSQFLSDNELMVKWHDGYGEMAAYNLSVGNEAQSRRGSRHYFQPALTYTERTASRFSVRLLPPGSIFSNAGPGILPVNADHLLPLLGVLSSTLFYALHELCLGGGDSVSSGSAARHYTSGLLAKMPFPDVAKLSAVPSRNVQQLLEMRLRDLMASPTSSFYCAQHARIFDLGSLQSYASEHLVAFEDRFLQAMSLSWEIDLAVTRSYGADESSLDVVASLVGRHPYSYAHSDGDGIDQARFSELFGLSDDDLVDAAAEHLGFPRYIVVQSYVWDRRYELLCHYFGISPQDVVRYRRELGLLPPGLLQVLAEETVSYLFGVAFGRWVSSCQEPVNGVALLEHGIPAKPPALIGNDRAVEASVELVDDPGHKNDVILSLRRAIKEAHCEADHLLEELSHLVRGGAGDLRSWIRRSFFDVHIKSHSMHRRSAPIYWELATPSHGYAVWLYYHRFTADTFYKVLNDHVKPKLIHEEQKLSRIRAEAGMSPTRAQEKEIEAQASFVTELTSFREEIEGIAPLWNPDLNDGVIINFAPLWRLVPQHKSWQKECKDYWVRLIAGEYDWAHLAMHLWPERVVPECREDRSLAIAHGLEDLLWVEDYGRWRALSEPADEIKSQKKRWRLKQHDRLRDELASLAQGASAKRTAAEVWMMLEAGDLDDTCPALLLWPRRVVEKCALDPRLADKLHVNIPRRRTDKAIEQLVKKYEENGCGDMVDAVCAAVAERDTPYPRIWKSLETGEIDEQALALALWPDRVVDKCAGDVGLAQKHDLARFFWYDDPWSKAWRRRESPDVEVKNEIAHRHKPAVKAALESLLSAPTPGTGTKRQRKK